MKQFETNRCGNCAHRKRLKNTNICTIDGASLQGLYDALWAGDKKYVKACVILSPDISICDEWMADL